MPKNYRVRSHTRVSTQVVTEQESAAIQNYLSVHYNWPVSFSRRIVLSRSSSDLRDSITMKNGDVYTLQGETLYCAARMAHAKPLEALGNGLFMVQSRDDGDNIYLELARVTDFSPVAAMA